MAFRIISRKPLREFWTVHPKAEEPLRAWIKLMEHMDIQGPEELRRVFASKVDQVKQFTVFDIGGNKYRLITVIDYEWGKAFIRAVLTHKEYDQEHWKDDEFGKPRPSSKRK